MLSPWDAEVGSCCRVDLLAGSRRVQEHVCWFLLVVALSCLHICGHMIFTMTCCRVVHWKTLHFWRQHCQAKIQHLLANWRWCHCLVGRFWWATVGDFLGLLNWYPIYLEPFCNCIASSKCALYCPLITVFRPLHSFEGLACPCLPLALFVTLWQRCSSCFRRRPYAPHTTSTTLAYLSSRFSLIQSQKKRDEPSCSGEGVRMQRRIWSARRPSWYAWKRGCTQPVKPTPIATSVSNVPTSPTSTKACPGSETERVVVLNSWFRPVVAESGLVLTCRWEHLRACRSCDLQMRIVFNFGSGASCAQGARICCSLRQKAFKGYLTLSRAPSLNALRSLTKSLFITAYYSVMPKL